MPRRGQRCAVAAGCVCLLLAACVPALAVVPPNVGSPPTNTEREALSHLLASGVAAAWNARAAAKTSQAPTVLIGDNWGNGKPPNLFSGKDYIDAKIVGGGIDPNPQGLTASDHGYHTTGIIFGSFANDGTGKGLVTGVFPKRGKLVPIDGQNDALLWGDETKFAPAIAAVSGKVVVNTSLSDGPDQSGAAAVDWIDEVRQRDLEDRVFHATAAGNDGLSGGSALAASSWSAAATRQNLQDGGNPVAPLTNTLSVENATELGDASVLGCLNAQSNTDGSIAAPGTDVRSFNRHGAPLNLNGTSEASPVVAGLATYLWSIDDQLTPQQLVAAITMNADPPAICAPASAPLMDAYAAVLSLDETGAPTPADWPVRFAILDKNGDQKFNHKDLGAFAPKLKRSLAPNKRDWSRFDLNGDGFTGGGAAAPFDLDRSDSTRAGTTGLSTAAAAIEGNPVNYNEGAVADADVLCFYAYSSLYTGSTTKRKDVLKKLCGAGGTGGNHFEGGARDCELDPNEPGGKFCGEVGDAVGLLEESGANFTFYIQPADDGAIDPATCATPADTRTCFKATGTRSGNSFTGTAVGKGGDPHPFEATLAGDELSGSFFLEDPAEEFAQFVEFELTRSS